MSDAAFRSTTEATPARGRSRPVRNIPAGYALLGSLIISLIMWVGLVRGAMALIRLLQGGS